MAGQIWTDKEIALLGTLPDKQVAKRIGRTPKAVLDKRTALGIESYYPHKKPLSKAQVRLLGTAPDHVLAEKWGYSRIHVARTRRRLGIASSRG